MPDFDVNIRPQPDEYSTFYQTYIGMVPDGWCLSLLESQVDQLRVFFARVTEQQASISHPPYTWTIKQVIGHMIDTERVFAERLHHFACNHLQPINGIDQDEFVRNADYLTPSLHSLVNEFTFCRQANNLLVRRVKPTAWLNRGLASGHSVSARALVWMMVGHVMYHMRIVEQRLAGDYES